MTANRLPSSLRSRFCIGLAGLLFSAICSAAPELQIAKLQPVTLQPLLQQATAPSHEAAIALAASGNFRAASEIMAQLVLQSPQRRDYWLNWGDWALAAGKTEQAIYAYNSILKLQPDNSHAHVNLILALALSRQLASAENLRLMLDQQQPLSAKLRRNLGMAEQLMGNCPAARASLQQALQQAPQDANTWVALARCQSAGEAEESLRQAVKLQPDWQYPRNLLNSGVQQTAVAMPTSGR